MEDGEFRRCARCPVAAADEDIRPPAGRDKRDPPASTFPFPKLIVADTNAAIGYNIGVRRRGFCDD